MKQNEVFAFYIISFFLLAAVMSMLPLNPITVAQQLTDKLISLNTPYFDYSELNLVRIGNGIDHSNELNNTMNWQIAKPIENGSNVSSVNSSKNTNDDLTNFNYALNLEQVNKDVVLKELNLSNFSSVTINWGNNPFVVDELVITPAGLVSLFERHGSIFLLQANSIDIQNKTISELAGWGIIDLDGFKYNEQNGKIYAYGNYYYQKGDPSDLKFGLGREYSNHSLFIIDTKSPNITNMVTIWGETVDGDETYIDNIFLNYDRDELYVAKVDEGDLDSIFVLDIPSLKLKKEIPIHCCLYGGATYESVHNILFACDNDSILGINLNDTGSIVKNTSSEYCLKAIKADSQIAYFEDDSDNKGFIDLQTGIVKFLFEGGNLSDFDIYGDVDDKYALLVAHSDPSIPNCLDNSSTQKHSSYVIKVDLNSGSVKSIIKFDGAYIDKIVKDPTERKSYITVIVKEQGFLCSAAIKIYDLGTKL